MATTMVQPSGPTFFDTFGRMPNGGMDCYQASSRGPTANGSGNSAALQQKLARQRQLALERQRSSARTRLGAQVLAQSNPLLSPVHSAPTIMKSSGLYLDGTVSPGSDLYGSRNLPAGGASDGFRLPGISESSSTWAKTEEEKDRTPVAEPIAPTGGRNSLDDLLDGLAEEMLDDCPPQARPVDDRPPKVSGIQQPSAATSRVAPGVQGSNSGWGRPAPSFGTAASLGPASSLGGRSSPANDADAWFGPNKGAPASKNTVNPGDAVEEVSEFDSPSRPALGRNAARRRDDEDSEEGAVKTAAAPSWDLNVGGQEPGDQQKGRKWWKPWQGSGAKPSGAESEVTAISAFSND